ncbi:FtsX-like permease family protein [Flammeovirgaceae bacterium SG7u.111]|nr:FtsX-like permease family protein [Flammeovirgaceae bacterium SG7u.132]WPO37161.1 FtsX-like permease family protein [Flammeovirgaceae bacterium SG7u.111]
MIKKLANRLFKWFCHPDFYDEIEGDLEEMYQRNLKNGVAKANWQYFFQVLGLFRPSLMRSFFHQPLFNVHMFSNYFKISFRILVRQKFYSAINIVGLAVGMGVCLLIFQYLHFEMSYDTFHENADNLYRITQTVKKNGEVTSKGIDVTYGLGASIKEEIPEVRKVVRVNPQELGLIVINEENDVRHQENNMWYVEDNFLEVFNFPLKYGAKETVLADMHSIVLTEQLAQKYFGDTNPIGKELKVSGGSLTGDFIVTGVLEKLPENSHLQFDLLMPIQFMLSHWRMYKESDGWKWQDFTTYVAIDKTQNLGETAAKIDQLVRVHLGGALKEFNIEVNSGFQAVPDIHLTSDGLNGEIAKNNGNSENILYFAIIGIFILVIAWINYVNLSTARAMHRAKEVGVRKSIGAKRRQLVSQFLVESVLINVLAAVLALGIAYYLLPVLSAIVGKEISFAILQDAAFWQGFLFILMLGSLLSGLYPAFVLSSFKPISVLKSVKLSYSGGFNLRKNLIVFQFFISIILISGTYLVYKQISYMKGKDLGFDMEKILVVNGPRVVLEKNRESLGALYQQFKTESQQFHTIGAVTATSDVPGKGYTWSEGAWKPNQLQEENIMVNAVLVDTAFGRTYGLDYLAQASSPSQISVDQEYIIVDEETVKSFDLGLPSGALNEKVIYGGDTLEIVGVVKNMHWNSVKEKYSPIFYVIDNQYGAYYSIQMNLSDIPESISHIEQAYKKAFPDDPFDHYFLDDDFNRQYQADLQFGNLFSAFSILAIFIACLGLFALVSYSATLRIKEIGIRKVLGASVGNLMLLLSKEYFFLLIIAILLAAPVVLIGGNNWLENYAFRTEISIDFILIPALVLVLIAVITVSYRTYRSAKSNPVNALRKE